MAAVGRGLKNPKNHFNGDLIWPKQACSSQSSALTDPKKLVFTII
jgi:hypothetical protein